MKKKFSSFLDEAGRCWKGYKPVPGKKAYSPGSCTKEEVELQEGRPSQRHPLEGHEYHKKSDEALIHIAKDAHAAAEAMKGHNTEAENKYRDQANDSATVRHFRKKSGMPDWYKKKYGHVKEEVEQIDEISRDTLLSYANKVSMDSQKHSKDPTRRSAEKANRSVAGYAKAHNRLEKSVKEEVEELEEKKNLPGLWANIRAKRARGERPAKPGEKGYPKTLNIEETELDESEAWTRKEGQNPSGGLNQKGVDSYRAAHPGSKLSMAVTTKPSKL